MEKFNLLAARNPDHHNGHEDNVVNFYPQKAESRRGGRQVLHTGEETVHEDFMRMRITTIKQVLHTGDKIIRISSG